MKRRMKKKYEHGVYKVFPLFAWKLCGKCRKEFRRERGWKFLAGPFSRGVGHWEYVCADCAPSEERAHQYAISGGWVPPAPIAPPPPPTPARPNVPQPPPPCDLGTYV